MLNSDVLKNPIFIGIFVAIVSFLYFYWKPNKNTNLNYILPLVFGLVGWFIFSIVFESKYFNRENVNLKPNVPEEMEVQQMSDYYIIGRNNIKLPSTDVFIDIPRF